MMTRMLLLVALVVAAFAGTVACTDADVAVGPSSIPLARTQQKAAFRNVLIFVPEPEPGCRVGVRPPVRRDEGQGC